MPLVVPDVVRYAIHGRNSAARPVVNIIDVKLTTNTGAITRQDVIDGAGRDIVNAWQNRIMAMLTANYTIMGVKWVDLSTASSPTGEFGPNTSYRLNGGIPANLAASPAVAAEVIKLGSSFRGKRQGRMYLSPIREDSIDAEGNIEQDAFNTWQGLLNQFHDEAFELENPLFGIEPVVIHQGAGGLSYTGYGELQLRRQTTTQRRRLKG